MYYKRSSDLKNDFKLTRFAFDLLQKFKAVPHEWQSFPNPSDTQQRYNKHLTNLVFSVRTISYGSSFFPLRFMARALCTWAINRRGKNSVCNLRYGPQTRLVRGIYYMASSMNWILHCDWLPEQARWCYLAWSIALSPQKLSINMPKKNLAIIQPCWPHAWSLTHISHPLRIILCFLKESGILYKFCFDYASMGFKSTCSWDTYRKWHFYSFSFVSSINSLIPIPPPFGDLVCSV